jgi:flavin reductase (DIM6/NTAB) family NADH-FMN oxidoreductase RutF
MTIDPTAFRRALGSFATGVAVVTTCDKAGANRGITVNSFSSVSLDPPLILFCLDRAAMSFDCFSEADRFAVNVLDKRQQDLSVRFATASADKWEGVDCEHLAGGLPLLRGCLANLICSRQSLYDGGDHVIIVGRVVELLGTIDGDPLIYFQSAYRSIGPGT